MTWRAIASLPVLRDQANEIAPNRSRASDGLVGDENHQGTNSDHNPHFVPGVGAEIVTALDLTHDPAHGFDSYDFAEALRRNRDRRIKYVISNHRIFSSYASGGRPAWTWGSYNGVDPHTNHVHVSTLDAPISDTSTPWNLDGFEADMTPAQQYIQHVMNYRIDAILHMRAVCNVPAFKGSDGSTFPAITEQNHLAASILGIDAGDPGDPADLEAIIRKVLGDPAVLAAQADAVAEEVTDREVEAAKAAAAALEAAE